EGYEDVLTQDAVQQPGHVRDDVVEIDVAHFNGLAAAEREQLPGERAGPLRVLLEIRHCFSHFFRNATVQRYLLSAAQDHCEDVVEVVGDAAGQASNGFEPLRLTELLLEKLMLE